MGSAVGYLLLDSTGFKQGMKSAWDDLKTFGDDTKSSSDKITALSSAMSTAGASLTKNVTTPLVGVGVAATAVGMNFESAMSQVQATMGITADSTSILDGQIVNTIDSLGGLAKTMGKETKFSASEAADAINILAMAGYDTEKIFGTLPNVLSLAAAGGLGIAEAADISTGVMAGFNYEAERSAEVADKIAILASSAKGSVQDFGIGMAAVSGQARVTGQDFDDVAVALGILGNNNLAAAEGGNALVRILKNLYQPTDAAKEAMQKLGLSVYDVEGNAKALPDVLQDLQNQLAPLSQEDYNDVLGKIFDAATLKSVPFLIDGVTEAWNMNGDVAGSLIDIVQGAGDAYDGMGAAAGQAQIQMDNLKGQLTIVKSALEGIGIDIYEVLAPYIMSFVEKIQDLTTWFGNLDESTKETIVKIGAMVAAIGPALLIGSKITGMIASIIGKINPLSLAITAIIAIIAHLWATNEEFRDKVIEIWGKIKDVISNVVIFIGEFVVTAMEELSAFWERNGQKIKDITEKIWELVGIIFVNVLENISNFISDFVEFATWIWESYGEDIKRIAKAAWDFIGVIIESVLGIIEGVLDVFIGLFTGDWQKFTDGLKSIWSSLWDAIKVIIETAWNILSGAFETLFEAISNWFEGLVNSAIEWGKALVEGIWSGITGAVGWLGGKIGGFIDGIKEKFTGKDGFDIQSPSKVGEIWGRHIDEGIAKGVIAYSYMPYEAMETMVAYIGSSLDSVNSFVSNTVSIIEKEFILWQKLNKDLEGSSEELIKKLNVQNQSHEYLTEQIKVTEDALNSIISIYGETSNEALELKNNLLDLQIQHADLTNSINETTKAYEGLADAATSARISSWDSKDSSQKASSRAKSTKERQNYYDYYEDEIRAISRERGVDLGVAQEIHRNEINVNITASEPLDAQGTVREIKKAIKDILDN